MQGQRGLSEVGRKNFQPNCNVQQVLKGVQEQCKSCVELKVNAVVRQLVLKVFASMAGSVKRTEDHVWIPPARDSDEAKTGTAGSTKIDQRSVVKEVA